MKSLHIIIKGTVTGVGFRWWLKINAEERSICGFVKNRTQSEVEAVLVGQEKDLEDILKLCKKGPSSANVENIKIADYKKVYLKKSFDIL